MVTLFVLTVKHCDPKKDLKREVGKSHTQLGAGDQVGWAQTQAEFVVLQAGIKLVISKWR